MDENARSSAWRASFRLKYPPNNNNTTTVLFVYTNTNWCILLLLDVVFLLVSIVK